MAQEIPADQPYESERSEVDEPIKELSKKDKKKEEQLRQYRLMERLIDGRRFVLEADYIGNNRGTRIPVSPMINFVLLDSLRAVIQIGNNSSMGSNGLGGVTAEGRITKWEVNKDEKRGSFTLRISTMTNIGMYDVLMFISGNGNSSASISGMRAGSLTYDGEVVPLRSSRVFKGRSL